MLIISSNCKSSNKNQQFYNIRDFLSLHIPELTGNTLDFFMHLAITEHSVLLMITCIFTIILCTYLFHEF